MIKLFKVCGFLRQSLKSPSAEGEMLHALKTGGAPADGFKGVKSSLQGRFSLLCAFEKSNNILYQNQQFLNLHKTHHPLFF